MSWRWWYIVYTITMVENEFGVYKKDKNTCVFLWYSSYHSRHVFRGWLKAEKNWLLTHSSNISIWLEECPKFYDLHDMRATGCPAHAVPYFARYPGISEASCCSQKSSNVDQKSSNVICLFLINWRQKIKFLILHQTITWFDTVYHKIVYFIVVMEHTTQKVFNS